MRSSCMQEWGLQKTRKEGFVEELAHLVLDASQAAEGLHLCVLLEGVAEALHHSRLHLGHGHQLRQLVQLEVAHACRGTPSKTSITLS